MTTNIKTETTIEMRTLDAQDLDQVAGGLIAGDGGCTFPRPRPPVGCWPPRPPIIICWPPRWVGPRVIVF